MSSTLTTYVVLRYYFHSFSVRFNLITYRLHPVQSYNVCQVHWENFTISIWQILKLSLWKIKRFANDQMSVQIQGNRLQMSMFHLGKVSGGSKCCHLITVTKTKINARLWLSLWTDCPLPSPSSWFNYLFLPWSLFGNITTYLLKTSKGDAIKMNISQYTWDLTKKNKCRKYYAIHKRSWCDDAGSTTA